MNNFVIENSIKSRINVFKGIEGKPLMSEIEVIFIRFRTKLREMMNFEQFSCGEGGSGKRHEG